MKFNINNKIELALGAIFDFKGTAMTVVKDTVEPGCDDCYFCHDNCCAKFECLAEEREDETHVHFECFKEVKYENN